jgi:hypothetical protein
MILIQNERIFKMCDKILVQNGSKGEQELFRNLCNYCGSICYSFTKSDDYYCNKICRLAMKRRLENEISDKHFSRR